MIQTIEIPSLRRYFIIKTIYISKGDVLIKTQRVNLSLSALVCLTVSTITELAKNFLCLPDPPYKKKY